VENEDVLLLIKYNLLGRILLILFSWFGLAVSIFLIAENVNILFKIIAILIFIQSLWLFFDVCFFKEIKITTKVITKVWLFGRVSVPIKEIDYVYRSFYKINHGKIVFQSKSRTFFIYNFMSIYLLGISDYQQVILQMKEVFKKLNLLAGDEYEWNY
jgi:hypothetical protein